MKLTGKPKPMARPAVTTAICVLAGGLGSRMGRDKKRLRLGGRSLLIRIKETAETFGLPLRVIRRDLVPRCGPLGGVYTALKTSRSEAELFLACDMPFVSPALIAKLLNNAGSKRQAVFVTVDGVAGFPFLLSVLALPVVEKQIRSKDFSLQALARELRAKRVNIPRRRQRELFNINTPEDWRAARRMPLAAR